MANQKLKELLGKAEELKERKNEIYAEAEYDSVYEEMLEEIEAELDEVLEEIKYLREVIRM